MCGVAAGAMLFFALSVASAAAEGPNAIRSLAGCSANSLAPADDQSVQADIGFDADFYGTTYSELFVNNNGSVSFNDGAGEFTPIEFTVTGDPIIAPFLADVDTSGAGSSVTTYGQTTVGGASAFCVNWVNVGYAVANDDRLNSFQLLLIDRGGEDFDIEFNYDKVQWESGDDIQSGSGGLGGTAAAVGWASGDGDPDHSTILPGSYAAGALLDGGPAATRLIANSRGTSQLGRYIYEIRADPPSGAEITGAVESGGEPLPGVPVEICRTSGGPCVTRFTNTVGVAVGEYRASNLAAGTYTLRAYDPDGELAEGSAPNVTVSGTATFGGDISLGDPVQPPPAGTTIENVGTSAGGLPVVYWDEALDLATTGCSGGTASYDVLVDGAVIRNDLPMAFSSGQFTAVVAPLSPASGVASVVITVDDCPPSTSDEIEFAIHINPSGFVRTNGGVPIAGARVVLLRASLPGGPFAQVPRQGGATEPGGAAIMAPGNRANPALTNANGKFGWDVVAGYYKIHASASGCVTEETPVFTIPPPVANLEISLNCSGDPPPSLSITSGPSGPTNNPSPSFGFNAESGSTVACSIDQGSASFGPCSGASSHSPASPLSDGAYTFRVRATDGAGNQTTQTRSFTVDTQVQPNPDPPSPNPDTKAPQTTIDEAPKAKSTKRKVSFEFSADEQASFQCKLEGKKVASGLDELAPCGSPKKYKKLKPGKYKFSVLATDSAGNVDPTPATAKFKVVKKKR